MYSGSLVGECNSSVTDGYSIGISARIDYQGGSITGIANSTLYYRYAIHPKENYTSTGKNMPVGTTIIYGVTALDTKRFRFDQDNTTMSLGDFSHTSFATICTEPVDDRKIGIKGTIVGGGTDVSLSYNQTENNTFSIQYAVTKNTGISSMMLELNYNSYAFTVSNIAVANVDGTSIFGLKYTVTGGTEKNIRILFEGDNLITSTEKDNVTQGNETYFVTVTYQLKTGLNANYGGKFAFGFSSNSYAYVTDNSTAVAKSLAVKVSNDLSEVNVYIRRSATIAVTDASKVYDTEGISAGLTDKDIIFTYRDGTKDITPQENTFTIKWYSSTGDLLTNPPSSVGEYKIGISASLSSAYDPVTEQKFTVKITPYVLSMLTVSSSQASKVYTGSTVSWELGEFTISGIDSMSEAIKGELTEGSLFNNILTAKAFANNAVTSGTSGSWDTYINLTAGSNYSFTDNADVANKGDQKTFTITLTITSSPNNWTTAIASGTKQYNGLYYYPNAVSQFGTVHYEYKATPEEEYAPLTNAMILNVGTYYIKAIVDAEENQWDGLESDPITYTITKTSISSTVLQYNQNVVSWTAPTTSTSGLSIQLDYQIVEDSSIIPIEISSGVYGFNPVNTGTMQINFLVVSDGNEAGNTDVSGNYEEMSLTTLEVFLVTVDPNGGTMNPVPEQYIFQNQLAFTPAETPTLDGYDFDKWMDANDVEFVFETTTVTANTIIHATWTIKTYTVKWYRGTIVIGQADFEYVAQITKPVIDTTKPDDTTSYYQFIGWTDTSDGSLVLYEVNTMVF